MPDRIIKITFITAFLFILSACSDSSSNDDPGSGSSSLVLNRQTFSASADASGKAAFNFSLPAGSSAFQLVASTGSLSALSSASGNLIQQTSLVSSLQKGLVTNVPYYSGNAAAGQSFSATYDAAPVSTVNLNVYSKSDATLNSGTLKLNIVLLGPVANSEDILDALDTALEAVRITYSRAGITLDTRISNFDGPGTAPLPGDPLYQSIVDSQRAASITVVLASERKGSKADEFAFGTTGAVPFPAQATADSVIVIAIQDITGNDGQFDNSNHNDEKRLLGEEIGRFAAKALGLPNLVTVKGQKVTASDNIPDTPSCITEDACQEDAGVRTNLMYPEPLEKQKEDRDQQDNEFYPRDQLTSQQAQALNNSVLVD